MGAFALRGDSLRLTILGTCFATIRLGIESHSASNSNLKEGVQVMAGKAEEIKGRVKEAAGAITDDSKLRREGKIEQAAGKTKQVAGKMVEKAKNVVEGKR